jgi:beta-glucanase (GH16 family)
LRLRRFLVFVLFAIFAVPPSHPSRDHSELACNALRWQYNRKTASKTQFDAMNLKSNGQSRFRKAVKSPCPICFFVIIFLNVTLARGATTTQLIDVNFNTNNFNTNAIGSVSGGPTFGPPMSGAAVLGGAGDQWNDIEVCSNSTGLPLIYANGSSSPVTMTFTSAGGYNVYSYAGTTPFKGTPYEPLMENYLYNGRLGVFNPQTITLSGLATNAIYNLVLYNAADTAAVAAGRTTSFTVNNNTLSSTWNATSSTLIAGTDYVEFASTLSDGSGKLAINWTGTSSAEGDINGFQIVEAGPNILANSGFEAGSLTSWSIYGPNNYVENTAGVAHSGTYFYKVYGQFNGANNYTAIYQDNPSAAGAIYSASGWAYSSASDEINGEDEIWISVIFLDSNYNALALYRSPVVSSANIATFGGYSKWFDLQITNQCSFTNATAFIPLPGTPTGSVSSLTAPAGTAYVRYQIVFSQGPDNAGGSMYFDDLALNQTGGTQAPASPDTQWNIVWDDEFNGTSINTNIWSFEYGNNGGWGNNELEYYTSNADNAYVSNGLLHIVALQQSMGGQQYTSARMKTEFNFSTTYGRIVWSAALPQGTGMWPALWMLGTNIPSPPGVGWPACGEIDVMEENGATNNVVQSSVHFGNASDQDVTETAIYTFPGGITATNFHAYMLDWEYGSINFYVDGNLFESQNSWSSPDFPYPAPFNAPFFLIMNLAVGGNYVGNPTNTLNNAPAVFPAQMLVDYVRVYQKTAPLAISTAEKTGSQFTLSWPTNIVCHLQSRTNFLSGSWSDVAGSTNPFVLPAPKPNNAVFYRLESP